MREANATIARLLGELAELTELDEGDPASFRVRAYRNAERAVEGLDEDVTTLSAGELAKVRGIGKSIAARIREHADTGHIARLEELRARHPVGKLDLRRIPGLGPKSVASLESALGVTDVAGLVAAIDDGSLLEVPGFGERTVERLRAQIDALGLGSKQRRSRSPTRCRSPNASPPPSNGPVRARSPSPAACAATARPSVTSTCWSLPTPASTCEGVLSSEVEVAQVIGTGETKVSVVDPRRPAGRRAVGAAASFGAALVYFTGSKAHNIRLRQRAQEQGASLNEYGLVRDELEPLAREEDVYAALGLPWIPPELREDRGEIEDAELDRLPRLVSVEDLRGDLHDHTDLSGDGRMTLDELVAAAARRGLEYLAVTDHGEDLTINGVSRGDMLAQRRALRELEEARGDIALLHGAELNIGVDGGLDYDDRFLDGFDWLVASVHSHLDRDARDPDLARGGGDAPPGGHRDRPSHGSHAGPSSGNRLDIDRVLDAAVETGTAIEINASLRRLEPPEDVLREAASRGVALVLSTDAHAVDDLDRARHGVAHARRAGITPAQVVNTRPHAAFRDWLAESRG
jgi:DNA polymerase (family X)